MAEWSNAAVLKTVVRVTGPGVRIPLSPPNHLQTKPALSGFCIFIPASPLRACSYKGLTGWKSMPEALVCKWFEATHQGITDEVGNP